MDVDLNRFNPFDPQVLECPFPYYGKMRSEAPVFVVPGLGVVLVTRHDLVLEALRDPHTYSSRFGSFGAAGDRETRARIAEVVAEGYPRTATLLTTDPPEHTRYRSLVSRAFNPRAVAAMEPMIRSVVTDLIDTWAGRSRIEFVGEFAVPLPVTVIARALNVPEDRMGDFKRWSDDSVATVGTDLTLEQRLEAERGVNEFQHFFAAQIERRRVEPQDDLLTHLLQARMDDPDGADTRPLETAEMLSILQQLLVAGNETTTKMLAEMMLLLAASPAAWAAVRGDPAYAERIVEETLRLSSPVQGMWRLVTTDTELGGVPLARGTRVVLVYASANRDEQLFVDPDAFDPGRTNARDHLAFGRNTHFCLGAGLARLEARVALEEIARRARSFAVVAPDRLEYTPSFLLRGLVRLDLDIDSVGATDAGPVGAPGIASVMPAGEDVS